jgi:hypothetical protein
VAITPQPLPLQLTYIDPDGHSWFLSDPDMTEGIICEDIVGLSGIPVAASSVPLVQGGAVLQTLIPQVRNVFATIFIMSTDNAEGQLDYLNLLDRFTKAFTTIRDGIPVPGTLIVQRPDGSSRQCTVYVVAGLDQPNDSKDLSGLLFTTYVLTLEAVDPYFYDPEPEPFLFEDTSDLVTLESFDFEDGTDGWATFATGASLTQSTDFASSGTHSIKLHGDGTHAQPSAQSSLIGVSPGQSVKYTITLDSNAVITSAAQIGINAYAPDGSTFVDADFPAAFSLAASTPVTKTMTYSVPTDGSVGFIELFYQITGTPLSTTNLYGDNVKVENLIGILPLLPIALAGATSLGDVVIANSGTEDAFPTWVITGPGTPQITNNTTGRSWGLSASLADGEILTVVTAPGMQSAVNDSAVNKWAEITQTTPADLWALVPGDNEVNITMTSGGDGTSVEMLMTRRWGRA